MNIIISGTIFIITIYVLVVNKIGTNSNFNCKKYWKERNVHYARTTLAFMLIFTFTLFLLHQYFQYALQLIYQLFFFCTYIFHNLDITQHNMIYHIFTFIITRIPNKSFIEHTFRLSICIHT